MQRKSERRVAYAPKNASCIVKHTWHSGCKPRKQHISCRSVDFIVDCRTSPAAGQPGNNKPITSVFGRQTGFARLSMATRTYHRPPGTDGGDHAYRMTVDTRYKKLPQLKRRLKFLAYISVVVWIFLTVLQTLPFWHDLRPFWLEGSKDQLSLAAQAVTGGAIWTFALYWFGTGGNFWREDSPLLLKGYIVTNFLVALTAGILTYLQRAGDPSARRKLALKGMEVAELVLNIAGVVTSLASSCIAINYLALRKKTKNK